MTTEKLIEELRKYPKDAIVVANDGSDEGYTCQVVGVRSYEKPDYYGKKVVHVKIVAGGWPV